MGLRAREGGRAFCTLLAALMLFARLLAPPMAMPRPEADGVPAGFAPWAICHSGTTDGRAPDPGPAGPGHGDCQLCPACHLAWQAVLDAPGGAPAAPARWLTGFVTPGFVDIGPAGRPWGAAQPTGPPVSV